MKRPQFPDTHHYVFELKVGINSVLSFSPGEISTVVLDGLFALDEQGLLFPGVTVPEGRLRLASMQPVGYQRSRGGSVGEAYVEMIATSGQLPEASRELRDRVDVALESVEAALRVQRMLIAKLSGLRYRCHHPAALTEEDGETAEALLGAAKAIIEAVEAATKPVL